MAVVTGLIAFERSCRCSVVISGAALLLVALGVLVLAARTHYPVSTFRFDTQMPAGTPMGS